MCNAVNIPCTTAAAFQTRWLPIVKPMRARKCLEMCRRRRPRLDDVVNKSEMSELKVGGLVVPRHRWRPELRQRGVHRSVEYIVEGLSLDGKDVCSTTDLPKNRRDEVVATVRPVGRLVPLLECEWPVKVSIGEGMLWSYKCDVIVSAIVCAVMAFVLIGGTFEIGEFCGIYGIASQSMVPTLQRGDALFVEKVSIRAAPPRRGEIVLVRPPKEVQTAIKRRGVSMRGRVLLVKRVAAIAGDVVNVDADGVRVNGHVVGGRAPQSMRSQVLAGVSRVHDGCVYLLGDNGEASVDSRFWGPLPTSDVVGRPVVRVFPVERFRLGQWKNVDNPYK